MNRKEKKYSEGLAKAKENEHNLGKKLEKARKEMNTLRQKLQQVNNKLGQKEELQCQANTF